MSEYNRGVINHITVYEEKHTLCETIEEGFHKRFVPGIVTLVLALLLFLLAFCPFAYIELLDSTGETSHLTFNAIDSASLAVGSLFSSEENVLIASDETPEIEVEELTHKELLKYILIHENTSVRTTIVLNGIVAVIYIVFCLVALIVAAIGLFNELSISENISGKNVADVWLCAVISMLPVVIFCFLQMCHFGVSYLGSEVGVAWGAVLSVIIALCGLAFLGLKKNALVSRISRQKLNRQTVKNIICAALLITVMISVFMPCIKISVGPHPDNGNRETLYLSLSNLYENTLDDMKYYKTVNMDGYYNMIISFVEGSQGQSLDRQSVAGMFFYIFTFVCCAWDFRVFWTLIIVTTLTTLVLTGILLCNVLTKLFFDKSIIKRTGWLKILNLISIGVDLFLLVFVVCMDNFYLLNKLRFVISFRVGFAMLWMLIAMIVYIAISSGRKKKGFAIVADNDYDNADVSYAPYVCK